MMSTPTQIFVGIDVGTTSMKMTAATLTGEICGSTRHPNVIIADGDRATAFDLDAIERNLVSGLKDLVAQIDVTDIPLSAICSIGVTSIGESFVGLDVNGHRVTPCPTWFDRRTRNFREDWGMSPAEWYDITGMVDDEVFTIHRLCWWRQHGVDWFGKVRRWLNVADYLTFLLCGNAVAAPSLAARSGFADRRTGAWSNETTRFAGIDPDTLPALQPAASQAGGVTQHVARLTGLTAGTPVINAGQDHPCAALACGLIEPGAIIDSAGTAEALETLVPRALSFTETLGGSYDCHPNVLPGQFMISGHLPAACGMLDHFVRQLSGPVPAPDAAERLWALAAQSLPGARGLRIRPFLQGSGAPWNRRSERMSLVGMTSATDAGDILRAALESLSAWVGLNLDNVERILGDGPRSLVVTGGGARNALYCAIKAAWLERPLILPAIQETAGFGAALVGGFATGVVTKQDMACMFAARPIRTLEPDQALVASLRPLRASIIEHMQKDLPSWD